MSVARKISKAIAAGVTAGAGAAGIVLADLPWPAIIGSAALAFAGTFLAPKNTTDA